MDEDTTFFDAIPFGPAHRRAVMEAAQNAAAEGIPLDTLVPSAILALSPQDAFARNLALPLSHVANPLAPPFAAAWLGSDLERSTICLANAVYYEANGEALSGQRAVAQVVLNRLRHPRFPKTVCGVVNQGSDRPTGCQFSFTCDGSLARLPNPARYQTALAVATAALNGWTSAEAGQATHYHTLYVFPKWAPELLKLGILGHHIFYRLPGGSNDYTAVRAAAAALQLNAPPPQPVAADPSIATGDGAVQAVSTNALAPNNMPPSPGTATSPSAATKEGDVVASPVVASGSAPTEAPAPHPYFPARRSARSHLPLAQ